ncbi:hypothetical protein Q5424_01275 [Conexibacter sp. JD483]|uniref:hypothetical protein n=2 Tax=Conexibacter TaxID=191494 RepID=UPI0027273AA7|nr:hypothetical protein [Conexibacter sp. JD483]MDO8185860.1 hypothetical protein [Conexibacter sp. CPCC 205706]MDR9367690.1 hypothetical protein [Conexibacter sp. JD483]
MRRRRTRTRAARRPSSRTRLPLPVALPGDLADQSLRGLVVPAAEVPAYLDYVEVMGPSRSGRWAADEFTVGREEALDRLAAIAAAGDDGAAFGVAAVARASGRTSAQAPGEAAVSRYVDALLAPATRAP